MKDWIQDILAGICLVGIILILTILTALIAY